MIWETGSTSPTVNYTQEHQDDRASHRSSVANYGYLHKLESLSGTQGN